MPEYGKHSSKARGREVRRDLCEQRPQTEKHGF